MYHHLHNIRGSVLSYDSGSQLSTTTTKSSAGVVSTSQVPSPGACQVCKTGYYVISPLHGPCVKCPDGADCLSASHYMTVHSSIQYIVTNFRPLVEGSTWTVEKTAYGEYPLRITSCPQGYALVRAQRSPAADKCVKCLGGRESSYSLQVAKWDGKEKNTGLEFFCKTCPKPATSAVCTAGATVSALSGWWLVQEEHNITVNESRRANVTRKLEVSYR